MVRVYLRADLISVQGDAVETGGTRQLRRDLQISANERTAEDVAERSVVHVFVLQLGDHGDSVLRLGVLDVPHVEPVEGHEGDLAREFVLVHLFEDGGADFV